MLPPKNATVGQLYMIDACPNLPAILFAPLKLLTPTPAAGEKSTSELVLAMNVALNPESWWGNPMVIGAVLLQNIIAPSSGESSVTVSLW